MRAPPNNGLHGCRHSALLTGLYSVYAIPKVLDMECCSLVTRIGRRLDQKALDGSFQNSPIYRNSQIEVWSTAGVGVCLPPYFRATWGLAWGSLIFVTQPWGRIGCVGRWPTLAETWDSPGFLCVRASGPRGWITEALCDHCSSLRVVRIML